MDSKSSNNYLKLLKSNTGFRNLWCGQIVSQFGDWLNTMATYALILSLTGSGMAMAAVMMVKLLPTVIISPVAGVTADRIDRKKIMILADLGRFFVVMGFLFIDSREDLWILYALIFLEVILSGFFEPARSASLPSLVKKEDLVTANALSGSTWSVMLSFGSLIGGIVVALLGIKAAFILDALTYLWSGWFIFNIQYSKQPLLNKTPKKDLRSGFSDLKSGFIYLMTEPRILSLSLLKAGLAIAGGLMTLIPLYANQFLDDPSKISLGIGLMYCSRGIGAAVGPVMVKYLFGESSRVLQNAIACGFFFGAIFYIFLANSTTLWTASLSIGLATLFGSCIWVFSSALLHLEANKNFLGRVFSLEMAVLTLIMGIGNGVVGIATDHWSATPQMVTSVMAILFLGPGILWVWFLLFCRNRFREGKCVGSYCPVDPSGFNLSPTENIQEN